MSQGKVGRCGPRGARGPVLLGWRRAGRLKREQARAAQPSLPARRRPGSGTPLFPRLLGPFRFGLGLGVGGHGTWIRGRVVFYRPRPRYVLSPEGAGQSSRRAEGPGHPRHLSWHLRMWSLAVA